MSYKIVPNDDGFSENLEVSYPCGHQTGFYFVRGFAQNEAKSYDRAKCPACENSEIVAKLKGQK